MSVKINTLELENVKRIKAVKLEPSANGLTVIGGRNNQGKTSVLDAIAWALGGERYKPSMAERQDSYSSPKLKITLSNGLIVERTGKNSVLKVVDPYGTKSGQSLLNEFIEGFALNLPKFMTASDSEKTSILLNIIGVGEKLFAYEKQEKEVYDKRHMVGQMLQQKNNVVKELPLYEGVPETPISASELIEKQQSILLKNAENQRKRQRLSYYQQQFEENARKINELLAIQAVTEKDLAIAQADALTLHDESTEELQANLANIEQTNVKVRANLDREKATIEADACNKEYHELTLSLENIRKLKLDLLKNANLPLPELTVDNGNLKYKGQQWDNLSGSEQLKVATAIVGKLNPNCGFVLLDKLEQMDTETLTEFGVWLEKENLQAIATRVSTGNECSIIIEDGYAEMQTKWKAGEY